MSLHKQRIIQKFSKAANYYDQYASLQFSVCEILFKLTDISNAKHILDIGSGTGYLADIVDACKISAPLYQIDISHKMNLISQAKKYPHTYSITGDMDLLPFADNTISHIFSSMSLQWSDNIENAFKQISQILSKGGLFSCAIVGEGSLNELNDSFKAFGIETVTNQFISQYELEQILINNNMHKALIYTKTFTSDHKNMLDLLHNIKGLGANYRKKSSNIKLNKSLLNKISDYYQEKYQVNQHFISATWNIYFIIWRK